MTYTHTHRHRHIGNLNIVRFFNNVEKTEYTKYGSESEHATKNVANKTKIS